MTRGPKVGDPVPRLNNAVYGIMRNYRQADREYAIRVTGNDTGLGIYVNGVEFDGIEGTLLLDAKNAGERSFYDVTGSDSFTEQFKIPEVTRQARRQKKKSLLLLNTSLSLPRRKTNEYLRY